jgi:hypothetical protein
MRYNFPLLVKFLGKKIKQPVAVIKEPNAHTLRLKNLWNHARNHPSRRSPTGPGQITPYPQNLAARKKHAAAHG